MSLLETDPVDRPIPIIDTAISDGEDANFKADAICIIPYQIYTTGTGLDRLPITSICQFQGMVGDQAVDKKLWDDDHQAGPVTAREVERCINFPSVMRLRRDVWVLAK